MIVCILLIKILAAEFKPKFVMLRNTIKDVITFHTPYFSDPKYFNVKGTEIIPVIIVNAVLLSRVKGYFI